MSGNNKKKISVSLDDSTIISLMEFLSKSDFKNRSQAIDHAAKRLLNGSSDEKTTKVKQSISVDADTLEKIEFLVSHDKFRSTSHFMECAVKELLRGGRHG